jgi:hypothetical protein
VYSASTTSYSCILLTNDFEVSALSFLRKSYSSGFLIDNALIKLEVMGRSEAFALLSYEFGYFQLHLLLLSKIVISHKESVVSL